MGTASDIAGLGVVIVNFRTAEMTIGCLRSLAGEVSGATGVRVVVVDNGSEDGSADKIASVIEEEGWTDWVSVKALERNGGFAFGNNRGMEALKDSRYVLLLNSDTVVQPGCLRHCFNVMESEPSVGVMSCMLLNSDGTVQNVARRFPTPLRVLLSSLGLPWKICLLFGWADVDDPTWDRGCTKRDVDWLGGAFLFVRRGVIDKMGGLDEDFFFYGEDVEFCHRVWRAGYRCHYDPAVAVTHYGGGSSDPTRMNRAQRNEHYWRARYLVQKKCYGKFASALLRVCDASVYFLRLLRLRLSGKRRVQQYRDAADILKMLIARL